MKIDVIIESFLKYILRRCSPKTLFSLQYYKTYGKFLNYRHPNSFYEKIGYLQYYTDTTQWSKLADKIAVRDFIKEKGLGDMLTTLLGVYNHSFEIDYDKLPKSFVLKTNHGSATNIFVKDKDNIDRDVINKQLDEWLAIDFGFNGAQPHYSKIKPRILAEGLLLDEETTKVGKMLYDYKFYCINGNPRYIQVMKDREPNTHNIKVMVYDMNWNAHPEYVSTFHNKTSIDANPPVSFEQMKKASCILAEGFPFVRVDFYQVNGNPIFGEMTFTPGFDTATQDFFDLIGKEIDVEIYIRH